MRRELWTASTRRRSSCGDEGVGVPSDPAGLYTPDDIVGELPKLEIAKAEQVLRPVDDADRPAIDALIRARRPAG